MIGTLDELLVVSDIDNTLLNAVEGLPEVNRATIQLFSCLLYTSDAADEL